MAEVGGTLGGPPGPNPLPKQGHQESPEDHVHPDNFWASPSTEILQPLCPVQELIWL